MRVASQAADDKRAERVATEHAARFLDHHLLAVVPGDAPHETGGEHAEPPPGTVDEMQLGRTNPHRLEHRRLGSWPRGADHGVDQILGVLQEIERPPGRVEQRPGHLHEVGGEKLAEACQGVVEGLSEVGGDRLQEADRLRVGIGAGWQVARGPLDDARPQCSARAGVRRSRRQGVGKLLDIKEYESVHGEDISRDGQPRAR